MQVYPEDDVFRGAAHRAGCFDLARIDVGQCGFHLSRIEWHAAEDERDDGTFDADGRTGNGAGQRDQEDQQDHERDRTEHVHNHIRDVIQAFIRADAGRFRSFENHAKA